MTGKVVLMGSGELTSTMVELHKELLQALGSRPRAVFLDTPAGFQPNVGDLCERAAGYFAERVGHPLEVASLRRADIPPVEAAQAYRLLHEADYLLVGPGSPTYAVRQWQQGPVGRLLADLVCRGGCLVAASAAALTVGHFTLPVYEIYKVGEEVHWTEGINVLGRLGLDLVVVPHWNNAEGGNHDTRFCYMGEPRLRALEALLPRGMGMLGLDEHTACIMDLAAGEVSVRGLGRVTLRRDGRERHLVRGPAYPLAVLQEKDVAAVAPPAAQVPGTDELRPGATGDSHALWHALREQEALFHVGLTEGDAAAVTTAVLEVDRLLWSAHRSHEDPEAVTQGRELLRELLVLLGTCGPAAPPTSGACPANVVEELLRYRARLRAQGSYATADELRDCLAGAGIVVEDTAEGAQWHLAKA